MKKNIEEYYPNGQLMSTVPSKNGIRHGKMEMYFENGKLKYEGNFLNDKQEGLWKLYYENGDLQRENIFKNHIKISQKEYYSGNQIKSEGKYDEINQDKIGKWQFYFENGQLEKEEIYNNGICESLKEWDENGKLIKEYNPSLETTKEDKTSNPIKEFNSSLKITKETVITSIGSVMTNITLGNMLERITEIFPKEMYGTTERLNGLLEMTFEELEEQDDYVVDEWDFRSDHNGGLIIKFWCQDDGFTKLLKNVTGEDYLMMYATNGYYESETQENYTEIDITDKGDTIYKKVLKDITADNISEENVSIDNFLDDDETKTYNYDVENHDLAYTEDWGFYFIKKEKFDEERWWKGWIFHDGGQ